MLDPKKLIPEKKEIHPINVEQNIKELKKNEVSEISVDIQMEEKKNDKNQNFENQRASALAASAPSVAPIVKDSITVDLENLLSDDLTDTYLALPADVKEEFKKKGEETVSKIRIMIQNGKVKAGKILELLRQWLRVIPGVNLFFLEQEAKIKLDKVMSYAEDQIKSNKSRV